MRNLFDNGAGSLPDKLGGDLEALLTCERAASLTWHDLRDDRSEPRWFQVLYGPNGQELTLTFRFWIPDWMGEHAVAAILPARLEVDAVEAGRWARLSFARGTRSQLATRIPATARCAARLMNELWGRTEAEDVWLEEYAEAADELAADLTAIDAWKR